LILETSELPEFGQTGNVYEQPHYERTAVIRGFYKEGEDKIIFSKKLNPAKVV
jgi:hypothetical protein